MRKTRRILTALLAVLLLLPCMPAAQAVTMDEIDTYDWLEIDRTVDLTRFLPAELADSVTVKELLGEENYKRLAEKYGKDAVVEATCEPYYDEYKTFNPIEGGLNGRVSMMLEYFLYYNNIHFYGGKLNLALKVGSKTNAKDHEICFVTAKLSCLEDILKFSMLVKKTPNSKVETVERVQQVELANLKETAGGELAGYFSSITFNTSPKDVPENSSVGLTLDFADGFDRRGAKLAVYTGLYYDAAKLPSDPKQDVTDVFLNGVGMHYRDTETGWLDYLTEVTIVVTRGDAVQLFPVEWLFARGEGAKTFYARLYADNAGHNYIGNMSSEGWEDDVEVYSLTLSDGSDFIPNAVYYLRARFDDAATAEEIADPCAMVKAIYVGKFRDAADAAAQGAKNIRDTMFIRGSEIGGCAANFSGDGVIFTLIDTDGEVHYYKCVIRGDGTQDPPSDLSADAHLSVYGAYDAATKRYISSRYQAQFDNDAYYNNGYQALFLLGNNGQGLPAGKEIVPTFLTGETVSVYAAGTSTVGKPVSGTRQTSGESKVKLTGPVTTVQYSAGAENGICLKNYWVSYVTQYHGGAKLFVNGATNAIPSHKNADGDPYRIVVMDGSHGYQHDILVANIGDAPLTGLTVTLKDAKGVQLDPSWRGGDGTLDAFTKETTEGRLTCATRVRLLPTIEANGKLYEGEVSGTLTISAGNGESVTMELTGGAGDFAFTTEGMRDAVRFVPYDQAIQHTSTKSATAVSYRIVKNVLPSGLSLYRNGVIYGVPTAVGAFPFTVEATLNSGRTGLPDERIEKEFTIDVLDNTDKNVWMSTNSASAGQRDDYSISIAIPNQDGSTSNINLGSLNTATTSGNSWDKETMVMESQGTFERFQDLYLDGVKLKEGEDYTAEEGSTRITLQTSTMEKSGKGSHTLAAEFYETSGSDGSLRIASQNYTVTKKKADQPQKPSEPGKGDQVFKDVAPSNWFYEDVMWANENDYMGGVGGDKFAPQQPVDLGTVVTILARVARINLDQYSDLTYDNIKSGTWYTNAAIWATQAGMLPDYAEFQSEGDLPRSEMAIMLVKYLRSIGFDLEKPKEEIQFPDADQMGEADLEAFQILRSMDIFRGVGNDRMDPNGTTTRAEFATLIHRIQTTVESRADRPAD